MSRRRTVLLLLLGVALGAGSMAALFFLLSEPTDAPAAPASTATGARSEATIARKESEGTPRELHGDCVLAGFVISPDGAPADGAIVRARLLDEPWATADLEITATTDAQGRFSLEGLSPMAVYQLWAWSEGNAVTDFEDASCNAVTHLILERGAALEIAVSTPEGAPAAGARLLVAGSGLWPARLAEADADGHLVVEGLHEGFYVLRASLGDNAYASEEPIELIAGRREQIDVALVPSEAASVKVTSAPTGAPISNAVVVAGPESASLLNQAFETGTDGVARLSGLTAVDTAVSVFADGYVSGEPRAIAAGREIAIELEPGAIVAGFVRTEDGAPVRGATIAASVDLGAASAAVPSGALRSFSRQVLAAGLEGWPRMTAGPSDPARVISGPASIPIPIAGAKTSPMASLSWLPSDENGAFVADGLAAGTHRLTASHPEMISSREVEITLEAAQRRDGVIITMRPGARLAVRVVRDGGYPIGDAAVSVYDRLEEELASLATGSDGFARVTGLPLSFYVEASAPGMIPAAVEIDGRSGEETAVELVLPLADRVLRGRVVDEDGLGVPDVSITARALTRGLAHVVMANTGGDGSFALEGVGSGGYHVTALAPDGAKAQLGSASADSEVTMVLGLPDRTMSTSPVPLLEPAGPSDGQGFAADRLPMPGDSSEAGGLVAISQGAQDGVAAGSAWGSGDRLVVTGPPSGKGGLPVSIGGGPGKVIVKSVQAGSLVAGAGLSAGDEILTIDGAPVKSPAQARQAIEGVIGTVVMLEVLHDGEPVNVVVQRVRVR